MSETPSSEPNAPAPTEPEAPAASEPEASDSAKPGTPASAEPEAPASAKPGTPATSEPEVPATTEPEAPAPVEVPKTEKSDVGSKGDVKSEPGSKATKPPPPPKRAPEKSKAGAPATPPAGKQGKDRKSKKGKKKKKKEPEPEQTLSIASSGLIITEVDKDLKNLLDKGTPVSGSEPIVKVSSKSSLSIHSDDSASSREDQKDAIAFLDDYNFQEKSDFAIKSLQGNSDIPAELQVTIQTLLQNFQKALKRNKLAKDKAESELAETKEKVKSDLQKTGEFEEKMNKLQQKIDGNDVTISNLKKELDESYARQQELVEDCSLLNKKIEYLGGELEKKQQQEEIREQGLDMAGKSRESFTKEIVRLKEELDLSEGRLHRSLNDVEELLKKYKEKETECEEMEERLKNQKYDILKEVQKSKVLEADLQRVTDEMRNLKVTVARHYKTFKNASQELVKKDEEVFEFRKLTRQLTHQNESMANLIKELKGRLEDVSKKFIKLDEEYKELKAVCSDQTNDLNLIRKKSEVTDKSQDALLARIMSTERKRDKAVQDAKKLFGQMKEMSHEQKKTRLLIIKLNRTVTVHKKESNALSKQIRSLQGVISQQTKLLDERNEHLRQMTEESKKLSSENETQKKALTKYFKVKEKDMKEKMILRQTLANLKEDFAECSRINQCLQKELEEKNAEIKHLDTLYHAAETEKKYLYKRLTEAQGQIKDVQNKSKHIFQEMDLVKDQLHKKQQDYDKLQTSNRKDVFTKDTMTFKLDNCLENRKALLKTIEDKDVEIKMQIDILVKNENRIKELLLEIDMLKRESGDLKSVIQKRNAELSLVYEKTDLLKYVLTNGEEQYQQRLKDIALLKKEIRKLRADKKVLISLAENTPNLRLEMFHLHKDLNIERQKCRALEEQMENPLNIHRWRLLEGRDPEKKDLIEKNQILQKKLIRVEHDNSIIKEQCASMEMLYLNMRTYLNNLPGKDATQYLEQARRNLRDKTKENKILSAELAAYENELAQLKREMGKVQKESYEIKEKYYKLKRKNDQQIISRSDELNMKINQPFKPYPAGFGLIKLLEQDAKIKH